MPFSVTWTVSRYEARFWRSGLKDTRRVVPSSIWPEYGLRVPDEPSPRHERVALRWAAAKAAEVLRLGAGREMTLREVYDLMRNENPKEVTGATLAKWAVDFANLERLLPAGITPSEVDEVAATRYRNARQSEDPAPRARTIHNELAFLRQLALFAHRWRRVTRTEAVNLVDLPEIADEAGDGVALTEDEIAKLLGALGNPHRDRNRAWLIAGICTMLRRQNLLGLRGEWIDWRESWLTIPAGEMKGRRKREHQMPIAAVALSELPVGTSGPLWTNPVTGRRYVWVDDVIAQWVERAGVRPWSLHDLRTTGNSWLQGKGVDEFTRAALLGHARTTGGTIRRSGSVTDGYTRVYREHLREAVNNFDNIFAHILA